MLELEENKYKLQELKEKVISIKDALNVTKIKADIKELEAKTSEPNFWDDQQNSSAVLTKMKRLQNKLEKFNRIESEYDNLEGLNELLLTEEDEELCKELLNNTKKLEDEIEHLQLETLLSGKYDKNNAILTLHPGARWNRVTRLGRDVI